MNLIIKRSHRKTIALEIHANSDVIVRAPKLAPKRYIDRFINKHKDWINKKLDNLNQEPFYRHLFKPDNGHYVYLYGDVIPIEKRNNGKNLARASENRFIIDSQSEENSHLLLTEYYKYEAKKYLIQRIDILSKKLNLPFENIKITSAKTRWGSCTHKNNINLSFRLIMLPKWVIDYVIIHELVHTKIKNHSKNFWATVSTFYTDYALAKKWISDHSKGFHL